MQVISIAKEAKDYKGVSSKDGGYTEEERRQGGRKKQEEEYVIKKDYRSEYGHRGEQNRNNDRQNFKREREGG